MGKKIRQMLPLWLVTTTLGYLLIIYAPIELYAANIEDFAYDLWDLLKMMIPVFVGFSISSLFLFLLINKISKKFYSFLLVIGVAVLPAIYIQGTFLIKDLPSLNGASIDWTKFRSIRVVSVGIWILCIVCAVLFFLKVNEEKRNKLIVGTSICGLIMLFVTNGIMCLSENAMVSKDDLLPTCDSILDFSTDENMIILLLDSISAEMVDRSLEIRPELEKTLEDFVFFKDTVGSYPATAEAVPFLFSGEWFENQETYFSYRTRAYRQSYLFEMLAEKNYRIGVYEDELPTQIECVDRFENMLSVSSAEFLLPNQFVKTQLKLVGLKYLPFGLKHFCAMEPNIIYANFRKNFGAVESFDWNNEDFYQRILNQDIVIGDEKVFRFYHLKGGHVPYHYDSDMNVVNEDTTYEECVLGSFQLVKIFLDKLRENNVYDNTVIVILADHGENDNEETCQNPMLLIKGRDEKHPFDISYVPISHADLPEAFTRLLSGKIAKECFDAQEGEQRARRFFLFENNANHMIEYFQYGNAWDFSMMRPSGNEYYQ